MRAARGPIKVGIVGLGAIGRQVCRAIDAGLPGLVLAGATARTRERAESFLASLKSRPPFLDLDALVAASDLVVEASTQAHLHEIAPKALGAGRDLVVLSCGALLGREDWIALAEAKGARILVPSGAIAGLDGVKGAAIGRITSVTMESRKPPKGLAGAPWVVERKIDLDALREETLIFEGPATFNTHRIRVEGEFGSLQIQVENVPSENPRTGRLSYLSTIALLRDLGATQRIGT